MLSYENIITTGFGFMESGYTDSGTKEIQQIVVADGQGGTKEAVYIIGIYSTPYAYAYANLSLHEKYSYTLQGTTSPCEQAVYLSLLPQSSEVDLDGMENNIIATTESDSSGAWSCKLDSGQTGTLVAWIKIGNDGLNLVSAMTVGISMEVVSGSESNTLQTVSLPLPSWEDSLGSHSATAAYDYPTIIISGTRPADEALEVYVSLLPADTSITRSTLEDNLVTSVERNYESFRVVFSGKYADHFSTNYVYVVWCLSDSEGLTASYTSVANNMTSGATDNSCLSGDTLITMADGTEKQLRDIRKGELVLSGDGTATAVTDTLVGALYGSHALYHFEDGTVIEMVHEHRFYSRESGFWQRLTLWCIGDHALRRDGKEVELIKVEYCFAPMQLFNLETESGTYYANGLLSGSARANTPLLENATAEQAADMLLSLEEKAIWKVSGGIV